MLNRREFTTIAAATTGAACFGGCRTNQPGSEKSEIDSHCHIWDDTRTDFSAFPHLSLERLQSNSEPVGIRRYVAVQLYSDPNLDYLLEKSSQSPGQISIVAIIDPADAQLENILEQQRRRGIRGYRLNSKFVGESWLDAPEVDRLWGLAAELDIAICLLRKPNASIDSIAKMRKKHPNTTVVIDHIGNIDADNDEEVNQFMQLSEFDQTYVKLSQFFTDRQAKSGSEKQLTLMAGCRAAFGSERLMWGSNAPVEVSDAKDYHFVVNLTRSANFWNDEDRQNIFHDTADRIFFS